MATLTIADLDNGKRDLQTVDAVANSRAAAATTRFGQQTTTLYESIRRINATGDAQLAEQEAAAAEVIRGLGFAVPVAYASGVLVENPSYTVTGPEGKIYAPQPDLLPFTTGAWDPSQWYTVQNGFTENVVRTFSTTSAATAAATTLANGTRVEVLENFAAYTVNAGSLVQNGYFQKQVFYEDYPSLAAAVSAAVARGVGAITFTRTAALNLTTPVDIQGLGLIGNNTSINNTSNLLNPGPMRGMIVRGFRTDVDYSTPPEIATTVSPKLMFLQAADKLSILTKRRGSGYVASEHWWNSFTSNETDTGGSSESWRNCVTRYYSEVYVYLDTFTTTGAWGSRTAMPLSASFPVGTASGKQLFYSATNEINATISFTINTSRAGHRGYVGIFGTTGSATQVELYVNGVLQRTFSAQTGANQVLTVFYDLPVNGDNTVMLKKVSGLSLNVIGAEFSTLENSSRNSSYNAFAYGDYDRPYVAGNSAMDYAFLEYDEAKWFGSVHGGETQRVAPALYIDGVRQNIPTVVNSFLMGRAIKMVQRTTIASGSSSLNVDKTYTYSADSVINFDMVFTGSATVKTAYTAMCATDIRFGYTTFPKYQDVTVAPDNRMGRFGRIVQADLTNPAAMRSLTTEFTLHPMGGQNGANMLGGGPYVSAQPGYNKVYNGPVADSKATITRLSTSTRWFFD